jgi:hypothetical protein
MAMTATAPDWRPYVKKGDVLSISATYETKRASWYESMGIMVVWEAWRKTKGAVDPLHHAIDQTGHVTHGHLAENDDYGGSSNVGVNLAKLPNCTAKEVQIQDFNYNPGGYYSNGKNRCIPTVSQGQSLEFVNDDAYKAPAQLNILNPNPLYVASIFHTVTSCENPCGLNTGISYPLANGAVTFDSAQLGFGTPAANRLTWDTPKGLKPGLYTYFCRIHPFMRGVFRVLG